MSAPKQGKQEGVLEHGRWPPAAATSSGAIVHNHALELIGHALVVIGELLILFARSNG